MIMYQNQNDYDEEEDDDVRGGNCCIGCSIIFSIGIVWGVYVLINWIISLFT